MVWFTRDMENQIGDAGTRNAERVKELEKQILLYDEIVNDYSRKWNSASRNLAISKEALLEAKECLRNACPWTRDILDDALAKLGGENGL